MTIAPEKCVNGLTIPGPVVELHTMVRRILTLKSIKQGLKMVEIVKSLLNTEIIKKEFNGFSSRGLHVSVYNNMVSILVIKSFIEYPFYCVELGKNNWGNINSSSQNIDELLPKIISGTASLYYFETLKDFAESCLKYNWKFN